MGKIKIQFVYSDKHKCPDEKHPCKPQQALEQARHLQVTKGNGKGDYPGCHRLWCSSEEVGGETLCPSIGKTILNRGGNPKPFIVIGFLSYRSVRVFLDVIFCRLRHNRYRN
jgi:hypothetical protein